MTSRAAPLCLSCKHLCTSHGPTWTCGAFPKGIPDTFVDGDGAHLRPVPGDHGIQFEQDPEKPAPPDFMLDPKFYGAKA